MTQTRDGPHQRVDMERKKSPLEHQHSTVVRLEEVCSSSGGPACAPARLHTQWKSLEDDQRGRGTTLPFIHQLLTHCLRSGTKTWPGSLFRRPGNFTVSWVWFWTTVWRRGSPTTPRAAGICRPSRGSPPSATLLRMQRTGG